MSKILRKDSIGWNSVQQQKAEQPSLKGIYIFWWGTWHFLYQHHNFRWKPSAVVASELNRLLSLLTALLKNTCKDNYLQLLILTAARNRIIHAVCLEVIKHYEYCHCWELWHLNLLHFTFQVLFWSLNPLPSTAVFASILT